MIFSFRVAFPFKYLALRILRILWIYDKQVQNVVKYKTKRNFDRLDLQRCVVHSK